MVVRKLKLFAKYTWSSFLVSVLLLSSFPSQALALDEKFDEQFYERNDILYYDPTCATSNSTGSTNVTTVPTGDGIYRNKDRQSKRSTIPWQ